MHDSALIGLSTSRRKVAGAGTVASDNPNYRRKKKTMSDNPPVEEIDERLELLAYQTRTVIWNAMVEYDRAWWGKLFARFREEIDDLEANQEKHRHSMEQARQAKEKAMQRSTPPLKERSTQPIGANGGRTTVPHAARARDR